MKKVIKYCKTFIKPPHFYPWYLSIEPSITRTSRELEVIFASPQIISTLKSTLDNSNHVLRA